MKYIAFDIETTGLDRHTCQILELGAIYDDGDALTEFQCYVKWPLITGQPKALAMHRDMFDKWCDAPETCRFVDPAALIPAFIDFVESFGKPVLIGRNAAAFDMPWLKAHASRYGQSVPDYALEDIATRYALPEDPVRFGLRLPSLAKCLHRAGIEAEAPHTSLGDCRAVVKLMRKHIKGR